MDDKIENLLTAFGHDLERPDVWWQIALLSLCLIAAILFDRMLRKAAPAIPGPFGEGGLRRIAFPLTALGLVTLARLWLRGTHPVNLLSIAIPLLLSLAIYRAVFYVLRRNFTAAPWLAGFERTFRVLVLAVVALHITGLLPPLVDFLETVSFNAGRQKINLWMLIQGGATLVATLLLALWVGGLIENWLAGMDGLDRNMKVLFSRLAKSVMVLLAIMIGLPLVGIDLTTLSVFGGALGVGLGLGMQKIASNYVSGFIILLDRSIRIGNVIVVGSDRGQVTRITTRYTVLRGVTGVEAIVPNEVLVGSVVQNESYSDRLVRVALPVQIAYSSNLERAMAILTDAARTQPRVQTDPPPQALLLAFGDFGIKLELGFWIRDPELGNGMLCSDINLEIWRRFKAEEIEIPFPQQEIRVIGAAQQPNQLSPGDGSA